MLIKSIVVLVTIFSHHVSGGRLLYTLYRLVITAIVTKLISDACNENNC